MTCKVISHYPGITAIVCGRRMAPRSCAFCKPPRPAIALCDFKLPDGTGGAFRTCDRPLCAAHRRVIAKGVDWCLEHPKP